MSQPRFYLPRYTRDLDIPPAVVVAYPVEGELLLVTSPDAFTSHTGIVYVDADLWVETSGPARMLSANEWRSLAQRKDDDSLPDGR